MAVRGVYTPEEEKMLAEWKRKTEGEAVWVGEEPNPETTYPVFHRIATKELILNNARGIGDNNPLWCDESYARNTRWGGIIAPPLFPFAICTFAREVLFLDVPQSLGERTDVPAGYRWELNKPIRVGDSFKVRDSVSLSIEDKTNPDGTGPRTFLLGIGRKYINQKDEVVCTVYNRRGLIITPPGQKKIEQPVLPLLPMDYYEYSKEELEFIDKVYDEEEICGAKTRYWEDVKTGDELQPVVTGPVTIWDQALEFAGRGMLVSNMREVREKTPQAVIVDPITNIPHKTIELHLKDRVAQMMGGMTSIASRAMIDEAMCRLVTNWMGDDGFVKVFDGRNCTVVPIGDTFFCKGKVTDKRIENNELLVDIVIWAETIRGYITSWATATVSLYSKNGD